MFEQQQQQQPEEQPGHHFDLGAYRVTPYHHTERFFARPEDMPEPSLRHRMEGQQP